MENIIYFLNNNSGAVIAFFTAIYVVGTFLMWWEIRKTRIKLGESNIQISLEPQARWGNFFDLVIENIGNTSVYGLKLFVDPPGLKTIGNKKLEDLNLFKKLIPIFGKGQKLKTFAISYVDFIHSDQTKLITFIAKYRTSNGKLKKQEYSFDMEVYRNMATSSEKSITDVVEQMGKIIKELDKISRKL